MPELLAGWSKRPIRVPSGYPLAGYIARQGGSTGTLDPLWARALVIEQGSLRVGIIVADVLLISNRWSRRLRSRLAKMLGVPSEAIIAAATHTHSGPRMDTHPFSLAALPARGARERRLVSSIEHRMKEALAEAMARVQPVEAGFARIIVRDVATDRNRPERHTTQPIFLLRLEHTKGRALWAVYGCHPTVLGARNQLVSGDLHGEIARRLEAEFEVALVANSAAANISTRFVRCGQRARELRRLGGRVARAIARTRFRSLGQPRLAIVAGEVELPLADLSRSPRAAGAKAARLAVVAREARLMRERLRGKVEFAGPSVTAPITLLRIGRVSFAALPFELYADTGSVLSRRAQVVPVCYANGYWGYVPSRAAASTDYEAISSPFTRCADQRLREAVLSLAQTVR